MDVMMGPIGPAIGVATSSAALIFWGSSELFKKKSESVAYKTCDARKKELTIPVNPDSGRLGPGQDRERVL
jgi:hypothetical protein